MSARKRKYDFLAILKIVLIIILLFVLFPLVHAHKENISVHDPVMIKQDDTYYLFHTGWGISVWSYTDMVSWKREKPVFNDPNLAFDDSVIPWLNSGSFWSGIKMVKPREDLKGIANIPEEWYTIARGPRYEGYILAYTFYGTDELVFPAYNASNKGKSILLIKK